MEHLYYVSYDDKRIAGYITKWLVLAVIVSIFKGFRPIKRFVPTPLKKDVCQMIKMGLPSDWSPIFCDKNCPLYERCGDQACGY